MKIVSKTKMIIAVLAFILVGTAAVYIYRFNPFAFLAPQIEMPLQTATLPPSSNKNSAVNPARPESMWGIDFSQSQAEYLKLDWKETYLAIIKDLGATNLKLHINWNWVEGKKGEYFFNDTDWQIKQAEQNNVKVIYVLGMKTGRWPECHIPDWAQSLSKADEQAALMNYITAVVNRYKGSKAVAYWQVENEPMLKFGVCPSWYYANTDMLKREIELVRALDPSRQIIVSDSGELSDWTKAAKLADIVGVTLYRNAWTKVTETFGFETYSFKVPSYYSKKAANIQKTYGKKVICIELQAEPWAAKPFLEASLAEQLKSMNLKMFKEDVAFARQTGFDKFYFWGVEWWYWMKTKQNRPEIWNEAKNVFQTQGS